MTGIRHARAARFAASSFPGMLAAGMLACAALGTAGCDPVTAATPAIGAARAAATVYQKGKFRSAHFARYDDVVEAVRRTAAELGLNLRYENVQDQKQRTILRYLDDTGHRVDFLIEPRTEVITRLQVNIGAFGPPSVGQLVLDQISDTLAEMGAYLDERQEQNASAAFPPR